MPTHTIRPLPATLGAPNDAVRASDFSNAVSAVAVDEMISDALSSYINSQNAKTPSENALNLNSTDPSNVNGKADDANNMHIDTYLLRRQRELKQSQDLLSHHREDYLRNMHQISTKERDLANQEADFRQTAERFASFVSDNSQRRSTALNQMYQSFEQESTLRELSDELDIVQHFMEQRLYFLKTETQMAGRLSNYQQFLSEACLHLQDNSTHSSSDFLSRHHELTKISAALSEQLAARNSESESIRERSTERIKVLSTRIAQTRRNTQKLSDLYTNISQNFISNTALVRKQLDTADALMANLSQLRLGIRNLWERGAALTTLSTRFMQLAEKENTGAQGSNSDQAKRDDEERFTTKPEPGTSEYIEDLIANWHTTDGGDATDIEGSSELLGKMTILSEIIRDLEYAVKRFNYVGRETNSQRGFGE